jgi:hypothetical protein
LGEVNQVKNEKNVYTEGCGDQHKQDHHDRPSAEEMLVHYLGMLRGMQLWFHGAHALTKGAGFSGDHAFLYHKIYTEIQDEMDAAIEKVVGLTNNEMLACPVRITDLAMAVLEHYPTPAGSTCLMIASVGLQMAKEYLQGLELLYRDLKEAGLLTLGLDDFLMTSANTHEGYVYLLQQRVKVESEQ